MVAQELEALKGWRQLLSLGLEAVDFATPLLRRAGQRMGEALSWLLVCLLGRALGLLFRGIRQSLVPNWGDRQRPKQQDNPRQERKRRAARCVHAQPAKAGTQVRDRRGEDERGLRYVRESGGKPQSDMDGGTTSQKQGTSCIGRWEYWLVS